MKEHVLNLSTKEMHELVLAFKRCGWYKEDVNCLMYEPMLLKIRMLFLERATVILDPVYLPGPGSFELTLNTEEANDLALEFERQGWTNYEIKKLCESDLLFKVLRVVRAKGQIVYAHGPIDMAAPAFLPYVDGVPVGIASHDTSDGSAYEWDQADAPDLSEVRLGSYGHRYLHLRQNGNLAGFLLGNTHLIPNEWTGLRLLFTGTVYNWFDTTPSYLVLYWGQDDDKGPYHWKVTRLDVAYANEHTRVGVGE